MVQDKRVKPSTKPSRNGKPALAAKPRPGGHPAARPNAKARKHQPAEDDSTDDPILLHRAHGPLPRPRPQPFVSRAATERAPAPRINLAPAARTEAPPPEGVVPAALTADTPASSSHRLRKRAEAAQGVPAAGTGGSAPQASSRPARPGLTVNDFVRAAGTGAATQQASINRLDQPGERGESHPGDDERLPLSKQATAAPRTVVTASKVPTARPTPRPALPLSNLAATTEAAAALAPPPPHPRAPQRIDGFGAEGVPLPESEEDLIDPSAVTVPAAMKAAAATHDPVLASLARPSREELAEEAIIPKIPGLYGRNGKLIVPPPLKGTREILIHQNTMADDAGLDRIQNDADLNYLRAQRLLVDFPESASLRVNPELAANRRCARPWTVRFAADTARGFYARFGQPLQVNSAVRTVAYQVRLQRTNGNAAAVDGEGASPHLTGQAIDIGKRGMTLAQIAWMRTYLLPLMQAGKIDVEEEFQQACFHISAYRSYLPKSRTPRTELAQLQTPKPTKVKPAPPATDEDLNR